MVVKIWNKTDIIQIKSGKKKKNEKISNIFKKCVDKLKRVGYTKITKTNSHR